MQKTGKRKIFGALGMILLIVAMISLLWVNKNNSQQAVSAIFPEAYFEGRYRVGDGPWQAVKKGIHIPATRGDVTLQGQFHLVAPDGEYLGLAGTDTPLAFYTNHIHITVMEQGLPPYAMDTENSLIGEGMCGENCMAYWLRTDGPVTLVFHNPHSYGNETAVDEFLQELSVYADSAFEKGFAAEGSGQRNMGLACVIVALMLLGTALFSALLRMETGSRLWYIGLAMTFAGGYFAYGAKGAFYWNDSVIGNTTALGLCMMLYMLCVCVIISSTLKESLQKWGKLSVTALGGGCLVITLVCLFTDIRFYDTWSWWTLLQSGVDLVLLVCLAGSFSGATKGKIASNVGAIVLLLGFQADALATGLGWWHGGLISRNVFVLLFLIAIVLVWQVIPRNINAAKRAKEMEAEQQQIRAQLQESRIAIMISQIQPHFIYNTLGTIQYLCKADPEQAAKLIQNFSLYLRGNFSELDSTLPIRFAKELEHVHCYTDIELVRFPDMTVDYDIRTDDFLLPALTVQPLVENAIKHGLMGREEGGRVLVTAYETQTHYCVKVTDDGVGFTEDQIQDRRKHVGIRNVRERLQSMCGGTLTVESQVGIGTTALIQIPKEGKKP